MKAISREEFLKGRDGIGGSTAGKVLGVSSFGSPADAYDEIVAVLTDRVDVDKPMTPDQERGILLEDVARRKYSAMTGRTVHRRKQRRHPDFNFLIANVDGAILGTEKGPGVLEIKCPRFPVFQDVKDHGLRDEYYVQMQHNLNVMGNDWGSFAIFHADNCELLHFDVDRDDVFIGDVLMPKLLAFWENHIEPRKRPIDVPAEVDFELPKIGGDYEVIDTDVARQLASTFVQAKYEQKKWAAVEAEAKAALVKLVPPESSGIEVPQLVKAKVREGANRLQIKDLEAWMRTHDFDIDQFKKRSNPYWHFAAIERRDQPND